MPESHAEQGDSAYVVRIIRRPGYMGTDDWHATVTRKSDGRELIFISDYLWVLRRKVRRAALDRAFRWADRYDAKTAEVKEYTV